MNPTSAHAIKEPLFNFKTPQRKTALEYGVLRNVSSDVFTVLTSVCIALLNFSAAKDTPTHKSGLECAIHSFCPSTLRYGVTSSFANLLSRSRPVTVDAVESQSRLGQIQLDAATFHGDGSTANITLPVVCSNTKCCIAFSKIVEFFRKAIKKSSTSVCVMSSGTLETTHQHGLHETSSLWHFLTEFVPRSSCVSSPVDRTRGEKHLSKSRPWRNIFVTHPQQQKSVGAATGPEIR